MRRVMLQFWVSLDGYSCDDGTELSQVMQSLPDDEQADEYFVSRPRQGGDIVAHGGVGFARSLIRLNRPGDPPGRDPR
jgi:hypothetical protein